jgi:hypothetical protein
MKDFLQKIGSNRRLAAGTLSVDFKKPWNFLHKLSASHCKSEADSAKNQKWWTVGDSNPRPVATTALLSKEIFIK